MRNKEAHKASGFSPGPVELFGSQWHMQLDENGEPVATKMYPNCHPAPRGAQFTTPSKSRPGFRIAYMWPLLLIFACLALVALPYIVRATAIIR